MHSQNNFGPILRNARLEKGYEIEEVARKLTLRTDIVVAIENEDFSKLPPQTYTKNMLSSYANMVGINPQSVVDSYKDKYYSQNLSKTNRKMHEFDAVNSKIKRRKDGRGSSAVAYGASRATHHINSGYDSNKASGEAHPFASSDTKSKQNRFEVRSRSVYNPQVDASYEETRQNNSRRTNSLDSGYGRLRVSCNDDPYEQVDHAISSRRASKSLQGIEQPRSREMSKSRMRSTSISQNQNMRTTQRVRSNTARTKKSHNGRYKRSKLPIFIVFILLILIAAIIVGFVSCKKQESEIDTQKVAISGLSDPEKVSSGSSVDPNSVPKPIAPSAATFSFQVEEGQSAYLEIYLDDSETPSIAGTFDGPDRDSIDVTGTLYFMTTNPDGVSVRVDGESVALTQSENTSWVYECSVDFNKILEEWKAENLTSTSDTTSE